MKEYIAKRVHELYWKEDINCARTTLACLSELFEISIEPQTSWSAVGLHGAGGYRAQCGLVEGTLMFIGIYLHAIGKTEDEIVSACYSDPPHMCENLTCNGIEFAYQYILEITKKETKTNLLIPRDLN